MTMQRNVGGPDRLIRVVAIAPLAIGGGVLVGPASQLYTTPAPDADEVEGDAEVIADLDQRVRRLHPSLAQPVDRTDSSYFDADLA